MGIWFKKLKFEDAHPAEETLLACVDGELSAKETAQVRAHLENCWSCRARLDELQETITLFVTFRNQIQNPLAAPPPGNWSDFDRKLDQLSAGTTLNAKTRLPNRADFWHRFRQSLDFARWSPVRTQICVGAVASVLIVALLLQMVGGQSVSAAELLENSIRFQQQKIERINQPVIYQKLLLERAGAKAVKWEMWRDAANSRYRQALVDEERSSGGGSSRRFINAALQTEKQSAPDESVLREVSEVLQANRMNLQQPLSAESFQAWRNSLAEKTDEIENSRANDGTPVYTLKTVSKSAAENGKITAAALTVQAKDWHAKRLRFSVKSDNSATVYEFVETAFEVVSLPTLSPEIFPRDESQPVKTEIASATPKVTPSPALSPAAAATENSNPMLEPSPVVSSASAPSLAATAELEIKVLALLNSIGADIGEEVTVTRTTAGELAVEGVVESPQRKSEISRALASLIIGQPGLRVRIETSQEAQARVERERSFSMAQEKPSQEKLRQAKLKQENDEAISIQPLETRDAIPVDAETRRYLRSKGTAENLLTGEVNRFAARTLNRSNRILLRALALRNLANRFSDVQLGALKPEARNQWLNLIAAHAQEIANQNRALRQDLTAVFGDSAAGGGETFNAGNEADLKRFVNRLSELAASNDRAVRAAFAFSAGANAVAVKGAEFRRSLGLTEDLANAIESAAQKLQSK